MDSKGNIREFEKDEQALKEGFEMLISNKERKYLEKKEKKSRVKVLSNIRKQEGKCLIHRFKTVVKGSKYKCRKCGIENGA